MLFVWSFLYAPTGISEFSVKETFYALLQIVVDSCLKGDILMVLGDFIATEMTINHVLVLTALDQEMEAPQCSSTLRKVGD